MFNQYNSFQEALLNLTVPLCLMGLFISISINFLLYDEDDAVDSYKKSPVETFSMTGFTLLLYGVVVKKIGYYQTSDFTHLLSYIGVVIFVLSTAFNIIGRFYLGSNWSNQVRLKQQHTFIQTGPYNIVRHPLYASIIWMIYAAGLIYANYLVIILNTIIFIPIMTFRANQEEKVLITKFPIYTTYKRTTGQFFPKVWRLK